MYEFLSNQVKKLKQRKPCIASVYYWITILAKGDGRISDSCMSEFSGFTKDTPRRELRRAREINPEKLKSYLEQRGETPLVVDSEEDVLVFYLHGGHALIEKKVCEEFFPDLAFPHEVVQLNPLSGFTSAELAPQKVLNRAPSKLDRMKILKRDSFRCRLCGRSPKDYVDVELHLHHILPWALGGLTIEHNLITLCKTCHDGLEPHYERELLNYVECETPDFNDDYFKKLSNYQRIIIKELSKLEKI